MDSRIETSARPESGPPVRSTAGLCTLVEFIKAKLADAEKSLSCRAEMRQTWAGGTDKSWRAVGCKLTKAQRLEHSAMHGRIEIKQRREVEMFKAVLEKLEAHNESSSPAPPAGDGGAQKGQSK